MIRKLYWYDIVLMTMCKAGKEALSSQFVVSHSFSNISCFQCVCLDILTGQSWEVGEWGNSASATFPFCSKVKENYKVICVLRKLQ